MYSVRRFYEYPVEVEKPTCMYEVKSLYSDTHIECQTLEAQLTANNEPALINGYEKIQVANLEKRQISLINQLQDLTLLLKNIKEKLLSGPPNKIGPVVHPLKDGQLLDVVIFNPPTCSLWALIVLSNWLKQRYSVQLNIHLHSTVKKVDNNWLKLLDSQRLNPHNRILNQLIITIIVKGDIEIPELRVSARQRVPVVGEVNILRYLATLIWPSYTFEDPVQLTEIDQWLDIAHINSRTGKPGQDILDKLNSHLSRNKYLVGGVLSLADVGLLSIISRSVMKLPQHVKRWKDDCCTDHAISQAWKTVALI
ncbi:Aminoacyl tRNA synthetase complex-interacting multifunctional protein 2 [Chamberlinius hualienensis]